MKTKNPKRTHPVIIDTRVLDSKGLVLFKCPKCNNIDNINRYDCLGADEDCVFCNQCNAELQVLEEMR